MEKRVALITGANRGLGFAVARQLAKQDIRVLVAARDLTKGERAAAELRAEGLEAEAVEMDVESPASVEKAVGLVEAHYPKLDVLINNAGVFIEGRDTPIREVPVETFEATFATNVFGVLRVTFAFLPLLHKSTAGRIVNISSALGSIAHFQDPDSPYSPMSAPAYRTSKLALNSLTIQLARELKDTPIKINATSPGWLRTDMGGPQAPLSVEEGADTPVWLATLPPDGPSGGFFSSREPMAL